MGSFSLQFHHPSITSSKLNTSRTLLFFNSYSSKNPVCLPLLNSTSRARILCSSAKDGASNLGPAGDNIPRSIFSTLKVRRLRVQHRTRGSKVDESGEVDNEMPEIPSSIPFLPHVTPKTLKQLYLTSFSFISGIIVFGGLIAPTLELKLGLGGTSYEDFIQNVHLPMQLSQVDPIVASFSGGAVGVISALMLIEANNVEQQEKKRCKYCHGTGYLACARCSASGVCLNIEPISVVTASDRPLRAPTTTRCLNCSGAGKVMCPTCLCTGMGMASEHDPRIDPFD
ncbi:hypothetical protein RJ640_006074 [Escallonia rubra]|uniref:Uncharacterized protein n=1 Tax=Escallonia rubra TaxID=112253 RepID=A0AA88UPE7_9ASTE|nr:hypothetical protein RJ640_006074 [Escallonia rubra]